MVSDCSAVLDTLGNVFAFALLSFAGGMYPLGLMLGSQCSPCCGQPNICSASWGVSCTDLANTDAFVRDDGGLPCAIGLSFAGISSTLYFTRTLDAPAQFWTGATSHCFTGYAAVDLSSPTGNPGGVVAAKARLVGQQSGGNQQMKNPFFGFSGESLIECDCERGTEYPEGFAGCKEISAGYPINFSSPYLPRRHRVCGLTVGPDFVGTNTMPDDAFSYDGVMCCTGEAYQSVDDWLEENKCGGYGFEVEAVGGRLEPVIDVVQSEEPDPATGNMVVVTRKYCQCTSGRVIGATVSLKAIYWHGNSNVPDLITTDGSTNPSLSACCQDLYSQPTLVIAGPCFDGAVVLDNSHLE